MENKKLNYYLTSLAQIFKSYEMASRLAIQLRDQMFASRKELVEEIKLTIRYGASAKFIHEMEKNIAPEVRQEMLLDVLDFYHSPRPVNNIDYLAEVIFRSLAEEESGSSITYFIAPGENYLQSSLFLINFSEDFKKISEIFDLNFSDTIDEKKKYCARYFLKKS